MWLGGRIFGVRDVSEGVLGSCGHDVFNRSHQTSDTRLSDLRLSDLRLSDLRLSDLRP